MCAPSAPPAPDYKGAAEAEGKSKMSSTYTPYGSSVYSADPASPSGYRQTTTLDPNIQKATDELLPNIAEQYSTPLDLSGVGDIYDKSYSAQTARLDPEWQRREESQRQVLANQGIGLGSEAYGNAMQDFGQQRNDAYQQARLASIATMPQTYELAERQYAQPLNVLNALRTGQQMGSLGSAAGADYMRALQGQSAWQQGIFNADMGAYNNQLTGAATIGAALISDRRLKRDIEDLDATYCGYPLYRYSYVWEPEGTEPHIGVMADEVFERQPEAVVEVDGYLAVHYAMLH